MSSTPTSITLRICAGSSGAPGGVSIHYKKKSDWLVDGWAQTASYCGLSLSGNCPTSRFDLGANACENITINASTEIDENSTGCGASTPCDLDLACDTEYVFRIFAHNQPGPGGCNGTNPNDSPTYTCSTAPCETEGECTLTWGYWKTHGPTGCNPPGHDNLWGLSSFGIGSLSLTDAQVCDILGQSPKACAKGGDPNNGANAVLILQHQLVAAMLNVANGAVNCAFANQAIVDANTLLSGKEFDCVGTSTTLGQQMLGVKDVLAAYNDHQCNCPVVQYNGLKSLEEAANSTKSSFGKVKTIYR